MTSQVSSETDPGNVTKTYGYTPGGTRLFQDTAGNPTPSLNGTAYYSYNNHSDVEALTGPSGIPTVTYGYTAYGSPVTAMFTGADAGNASPGPNVVPYNSYRFNAMPWDPGSGKYNMDARNYDPGLGSFDTRDIYAVSGGTHAFAGAKPASNKDQAGHGNLNQELKTLRDLAGISVQWVGQSIQAGARAAKSTWIDKASNFANDLAFETAFIPVVDEGTSLAAGFFQGMKGGYAIASGDPVGGIGDIANGLFYAVGGRIVGKVFGKLAKFGGKGISAIANALADDGESAPEDATAASARAQVIQDAHLNRPVPDTIAWKQRMVAVVTTDGPSVVGGAYSSGNCSRRA